MAAKKKLLRGDGWSFEPANANKGAAETVSLPPAAQRPKITVEKRPKGKIVTVVDSLVLSRSDRKTLAKELKNACGSGGGEREGAVEIQGDHADAIRAFLAAKGWRVK